MENKKNNIWIIAGLNVITLIFLAYTSFNMPNKIKEGVKQAILEHEYEKAGGKEYYEVQTKLSQLVNVHPDNPNNFEAQKKLIEEFSGNIGNANNADNNKNSGTQVMKDTTNSTVNKKLTDAQMKNVLSDAHIVGNENADLVVVEYSDLECPYCIRQNNETQIKKKLLEEYKDKVGVAFKNNRGVNHSGTKAKALATICAYKVGGTKAYADFYEEIFKYSADNGKYYPVEELHKIAEKLGLNKDKWTSCLEDKETLAQFEKETEEAKSFGLGGTPGTLIFNKKTGEYRTISGAYPYTEFKKAVDELMK